MITLGINRTPHNGSLAILKNNEVILFIESERLSNIKYDKLNIQAMHIIKDYVDHIDNLVLSGLTSPGAYGTWDTVETYKTIIEGLNKTFVKNNFNIYNFWDNHHAVHAATAFYNSGFEKALCVVKDGMGSDYFIKNNDFIEGTMGRENGSYFIMEYPSKIEIVERSILVNFELRSDKVDIGNNTFLTNSISEAHAFELVSEKFGFFVLDAGKVMGMSAYGKKNINKEQIYDNSLINKKMFKIGTNLHEVKLNADIGEDFQSKANFAYNFQNQIQEKVANEIIEKLKNSQEKNLCLSGGFFLNCVSNYNLLKKLPPDINIYIEPISSDAGNAIGAAKLLYHTLTQSKEIKSQKNIYYGPKYNYSKNILKNEKTIKNVTAFDVAKIISKKNIVAIYQERSEAGPRALGNRSILYDPRDPDGKNRVNTVKKREWFRPFAGSVLKEEAKNWFDLKSLNESKFMMFAVDVIKDKQSLIPAITHVDGTCRIQTVSKEDNKNFYNLINEFYKITNIPILFNTSFNLAGNTIVETLEDAIWTLKNSKINYLYLPEMSILIKNPNDIIE